MPPYYADLGVAEVRRDIQRHSAVGAILPVGAVSLTVSSDYYKTSGIAVSGDTGTTVKIASGVLTSRSQGTTVSVSAQTGLKVAAADTTNDRWDLVVLSNSGVASVVTGTPAASPALPSAPANKMATAKVVVHANDASSASYTITDVSPTS
jgi:hypothetical protein